MAKKEVANGLILHSDQVFQYTSHGFSKLTKSYGILSSMSSPGTPLDNAYAENFFSILKTECLYRQKPKSNKEARFLVDEYINIYNYHRIQLKTKLTPYELRCQS
ncbi:MAG TPA: hypothetical protein DCP51_07400 [Clostridiales bacterium]|nr:MAG: hypothetical protein A2Y40_02295 [Candidatus Margulisbacteria bacterium GWF2_35_9]HAN21479.1 hypothetical protein [Clostridiales bacterium]